MSSGVSLEDVNQKTQTLHKELSDKIEKAQAELQTEMSLDQQTRELWEDLDIIRSNYLRDYGSTHIIAQATFNETRSATETTKHEFQAWLHIVEATAKQGRGPGVCTNAVQPEWNSFKTVTSQS